MIFVVGRVLRYLQDRLIYGPQVERMLNASLGRSGKHQFAKPGVRGLADPCTLGAANGSNFVGL